MNSLNSILIEGTVSSIATATQDKTVTLSFTLTSHRKDEVLSEGSMKFITSSVSMPVFCLARLAINLQKLLQNGMRVRAVGRLVAFNSASAILAEHIEITTYHTGNQEEA